MDRILLTGASGPIGKALVSSFRTATATRLVRGVPQNSDEVSWNPMSPVPPAIVSGYDVVIHLAGESVMGRWTDQKKKAIRESRVRGTTNLASALAQVRTDAKPRVLICASAVGFYGDRGDEVTNEESASGSGFLPEVCRDWEQVSRIAADAGIRTVNVRIGLVLSPQGGALGSMRTPFKLGLGGRIGSGQQWWSWIHLDDIVGGIHHVMRTESLAGPVNLVAPNPLRNVDFTRVLASVLRRPAFIPVPAFALRTAFGKMAAEELLLASQRIEPRKLKSSGYAFRFEDLQGALQNLLN